MKYLPGLLFLFIITGSVGRLLAQYRLEDYRVTELNTDNGLPSNAITGMAWEKNGNLIFSTESGIVRYNGQQILLDSIRHPFFDLIQDVDGRILGLSRSGMIYEIKDGQICPYMAMEASGAWLFSLTNSNRFKLSSLSPITLGNKSFREIRKWEYPPFYWFQRPSVFRVKDKIVYEDSRQIHICSVDGKYNLATLNKLPDRNTLLLFIGGEPYVITTQGRLQYVDIINQTISEVIIENAPFIRQRKSITTYGEYGQKNPVVISDGKAWILKRSAAGKVSAELVSEFIPPGVRILFADYISEHHLLILGTESHGVFIIRKDWFHQGLPNPVETTLGTAFYFQLPVSNTTILTNHGYLIGPDKLKAPVGIDLHDEVGNTWMKDKAGNYWYSQKDSVVRYNPATRQKKLISLLEVAAPEKKIFQEYQDTIYIITARGVHLYFQEKEIEVIPFPNAPSNSAFPGDVEVFRNQLYISTCLGLYVYQPASRKIQKVFDLQNVCIRDIWQFDNVLFLGTYGQGIFRLDGNKIQRLPMDRFGYLAFAHCFLQDSAQNVWISTNRGIFRTTTRFMMKKQFNPLDQYQYQYYGREDGLKPTELNGGCKPCGIKIGELISFPSMDGLIQFDPLNMYRDTGNYPVRIENLSINGVRQNWIPGQKIRIGLEEGLQIQFSCAWWGNAQNLHLAYSIDGLDNLIIPLNYPQEDHINITRLPAGTYTIRIFKLDDPEGGQNAGPPILVEVETAWYLTVYGVILISLMAGLFFWVVFQIRLSRINEQKRKLTRLAREKEHTVNTQKEHLIKTVDRLRKSQVIMEENSRMKNHVISILSHDLITPLKYIGMTGRGIINNPEKYDKPALLHLINDMTDSAEQLEVLSNNILNWIKYFRTNRNQVVKTFDLYEMVERTRESLTMLLTRKGNIFTNNIPEGSFVTQVYEPLSVILFNLVSNANKYTVQGEIIIDYELEADHFLIHVSDTGGGIAPEKVQKIIKGEALESSPDTDNQKGNGLGYLIIRELMTLIKGEIQIESEVEQGTTVTLKLPLLKIGN